jgi:hypothetical protein
MKFKAAASDVGLFVLLVAFVPVALCAFVLCLFDEMIMGGGRQQRKANRDQ